MTTRLPSSMDGRSKSCWPIVPASSLEKKSSKGEVLTAHRCVAEYGRHNPARLSDQRLLDTLPTSVATVSTSMLNYEWAEAWVRQMKRDQHQAPSTNRHRHGALARCVAPAFVETGLYARSADFVSAGSMPR